MADVNANIGVHIDTSAALAELKALQRQLATFHSSVAKNSAAAVQAQRGLQTNLLNSINATGKFHAQMGLVRSSTDSFTHALEKNKLSMREYFRYAGGSTRTFGKLFKQEFNTISKVAEERVKKMQTQYIKMGRDASGAIKSMSITPRTLDMTNYANKTAVAAQKQALLNQLLRQGSTNLLNFGKNTQWAGRQLMVGFTIPLAYFGTAAAKTFMDLEKQAIRFKRVYGDMFTTTDETNRALADVQRLAEEFTKYGVAVVQTMEMAANAAAMGKTGADLTAQVAEATRLAVLGGVEQAQALETTISVTNAFGVAAEDLAKKVNFLNAVENQTVVSIEDLTIAIPKAGPVVKQLGGDVEDLAFFLTAMKEGGINASEGANALKSGLASLINPTKKASDMLAGFGINIKAIVEGNQGNIKQTVIDFSRALDTIDPLNRARAIEQLFGKFQFSRLSTLFQNVTKDGTQAARVLDLAGASVEELAILSERELGVLENAVGTDFKESIEKLKLAIAPIGKEFLKAITPVAKAIGSFLEKFNNLGDGTKKFIVIATTLVGVIGPVLLMTFGLLANGVANIIKLFITMRSGFLRAGANTQLLAQQTQYLNTEQLEAATVAASLNQAHTRLTQSFNMEATAVRLLRQAYLDATIAATNFARTNPGMMMPGGKFTPKKFASGVTEVPGTGNKDTVPSMLTPGEAVIPKGIAQDPRFRPIIDAMVNGTLQGFNGGVTDVKVNPIKIGDKEFNASNAKQEKVIRDILEKFKYDKKTNTFTYTDPDPVKSGTFTAERLINRLNQRKNDTIEQNRNRVNWSQVQRDLEIGPSGAGRGSGKSSTKDPKITKLVGIATEKNPIFTREDAHLNNVLRQNNISLDSGQLKDLRGTEDPRKTSFRSVAAHTNPMFAFGPDDTKLFDPKHLVADKQFINNYVQGLGKSDNLNKLLQSSDNNFAKTLGIDPSKVKIYRKELAKIQLGYHPTKTLSADALARFSSFDYGLTGKPYTLLTSEALGFRLKEGFYGSKGMPSLEKIRKKANLKGLFNIAGRPNSSTVEQNRKNIVLAMKGEYLNDAKSKKSININSSLGREKLPNERGGGPKDNIALNVDPKTQSITKNPIYGGPGSVGPRGLIARGINRSAAQNEYIPTNTAATPGAGIRTGAIAPNMRVADTQLQQLIAALNNNTTAVSKGAVAATNVAGTTALTAKEAKREARAQRSQRIGRVAGPAAGLAGMGAMAGYMTGNAAIGNAMMGVSALATIGPMLTNPITAVVVALTTAAAGIYFWNRSLEQSAKKQAEFVNATSGTTQKMAETGKITGKVGAAEIMEKRRQRGAFGAYNDVQRAGSMFGDTFLQSDVGKGMVKGFVENMEKFGSKQAASDFALQLSTYVSDGVLSADQAAGIAEQIGIQLGNTRYTTQIIGDLRSIIGPNGEDLAKDPLRIRSGIVTKATQRTQRELTKLSEAQAKGNSGRTEAAKLAAIGANNLEIIKAQADATEVMYQKQIDLLNKELDKTTNLEKQLELKKKISELESKQTQDVLKFNVAFADTLNNQTKIFRENIMAKGVGSGGKEDAYFDSLKASVKDTYKGTAYETMATDALSRLAKLSDQTINLFDKGTTKGGFKTTEDAQEFEISMSLLLKNKVINPEQSNALLELFAGKLPELQQGLNLGIKAHGPEKTIAMLDFFVNSGIDKEKAATISAKIIKSNPEQFDKIGEALASLTVLDGHEINMAAYIEVVGYDGLVALANKLAIVEKMPTPITKESILKFYEEGGLIGTGVTKSQLDLLMSKWQDFNALPDTAQKEAISKFITIYETKFADPTAKLDYMRQEAARMASATGFSSFGQEAEYNRLMSLVGTDSTKLSSEFVAAQVRAYIGDTGKAASSIPGGGGGTGSGTKDDPFLDLLTRLKKVKDSTIDVNGGFKELQRVLAKGGGDLPEFLGINQLLRTQGITEEFIQFVGGLEAAVQKGFIEINKETGAIKVLEKGEAAARGFAEAISGEFNDATDESVTLLEAQANQFARLVSAGYDAKTVLELINDGQVAQAIKNGETNESIDKQIERINRLKEAQQEFLEQTDPEKAFEIEMNKAMEYYNFLEKEAKAAAKPEIDRINDLIDANAKLIESKQRDIEMQYDRPIEKFNQDISIIDKAADEINKKYDKQIEALEKISSINEEIANQEKSKLTIADALTSGNVAAAASAVQDARAQAAASQLERQKTAIEASRAQEVAGLTVGGKTRAQIEAEIYKLEQDRIPILTAIRDLEDQNYNYNKNQLEPLQNALDAKIKNIDASRTAFENEQLAIQKAGFEADKTTERFKLGIDPVKIIKGLWDAITDKNITVTATYTSGGKPLVTSGLDTGISTTGRGGGIFRNSPVAQMYGGKILPMTMGGPVPKVKYTSPPNQIKSYNKGGLIPKYMFAGGSIGSDTVPAMLTPGEFVMNKKASQEFGPLLSMLNESKYPSMIGPSYGTSGGSSRNVSIKDNSTDVYNYNVGISVGGTNVSADQIAKTVMNEIKYLDAQRVRGQRVS